MDALEENAGAAVKFCRQATAAHPEVAHYEALLARATYAAGRYEEALALYRKAADAGRRPRHGQPRPAAPDRRPRAEGSQGGLRALRKGGRARQRRRRARSRGRARQGQGNRQERPPRARAPAEGLRRRLGPRNLRSRGVRSRRHGRRLRARRSTASVAPAQRAFRKATAPPPCCSTKAAACRKTRPPRPTTCCAQSPPTRAKRSLSSRGGRRPGRLTRSGIFRRGSSRPDITPARSTARAAPRSGRR